MSTTTNYYALTKPELSDPADIRAINGNMDTLDTVLHGSQVSLADAFDQTKAYSAGDVVMYQFYMYKFTEDKAAGNWDATKVERTTSAEAGGEASDLSVKVPEVISTGDKACYVKRAIPTAGALAEGQKLIGATLAWNQMVNNGNFASKSVWTIAKDGSYQPAWSVANNEASVTVQNNGDRLQQAMSLVNGHKYFTSADVYNPSSSTILLWWSGERLRWENNSTFTNNATIFNGDKATNSYAYGFRNIVTTTEYTFKIKNSVLIDLTQLFGSTIADAIYQMEQTTAGSGVAFFRKYFSEDYYAYESGKLESVNVSAHKAYDSNATEVSSITLDSSKEFRGLYQLVSEELRADGDVYEADGTVTRKYGIIDISTIPESSWSTSVQNNNRRFRTQLNFKTPPNNNTPFNAICNKYITTDANNPYLGNITNCVCGENLGYINIYDNDYTTVAQFLAASSGVYLVYELATPTTESATPYTNPQLVDADGTEEFVDYGVDQGTRDVSVPVGHESSFYDYTDGSITIPDLPFADGTYALSVTMNNGTPTYSWESDT